MRRPTLRHAAPPTLHPHPQFNARSESVAEKASFSRLVPRRRCLVVAEGFYEWKKARACMHGP